MSYQFKIVSQVIYCFYHNENKYEMYFRNIMRQYKMLLSNILYKKYRALLYQLLENNHLYEEAFSSSK